MILNKTQCDGVYLCAIIEEGYTSLSVNPYPGYNFNPIPLMEGIRIQEGSLFTMPYALGILLWANFGMAAFPWGSQLPFSSTVPSFQFKCVAVLDAFINGHLLIKCSRLLQW